MLPKEHGRKKQRKLSLFKTHRVAPRVNSRSVQLYLEALDCPRSLAVWLLFSNNEHQQLLDLSVNPLEFNDPNDFKDAYAATLLLSKYKSLSLDVDRKEVAFRKFDEFELRCKHVNHTINRLSSPLNKGRCAWLHHAVKLKIEKILGRFPFDEWLNCANWGPGSTTLVTGSDTSASRKFREEIGITRDLYKFICPDGDCALRVYPHWYEHLKSLGFPKFETGNKLTTVDKNAKTDRIIAIEPGINSWFQKSVGTILRRKLSTNGVDLQHQSRNQKLALKASIDGLNATIDFSSASDSIALELVRELIPPDWFQVMDVCRSHFGIQEGAPPRKWEKFSSMGNGFTFELESLIFYAVAICCVEASDSPLITGESVSVYGDDVIVPCRVLDSFTLLCESYGFKINPEKSFSQGMFRESCGSHYWGGIDVKPLYLKDRVSSIESVYRFANGIRRRSRLLYGCEKRFHKPFRYLLFSIPKVARLRIPETLGDGGFIANFDEATPSRAKHGIEGYRVKHVVNIPVWYEDDSVGKVLSILHGLSILRERFVTNEFTREDDTASDLKFLGRPVRASRERDPKENKTFFRKRTKPVQVKSLVHQWVDLGPWI